MFATFYLEEKECFWFENGKRKHVVGHILLNYSRHRETLAAVGGGGGGGGKYPT